MGMTMNRRELDKVNPKDIKEIQSIFMDSYDKFMQYAHAILEDRQTAQDVVQEAFLFAYETYKECRDLSRVIPYVYDFIRNECVRYLKIKSVEKSREKVYRDSVSFNMDIAEELFFKKEIQHRIVNIINKLEPLERRIIILKYYCMFPIEYIASTVEMDPDEIMALLKQIKNKIANKISNDKK
jgi:RNA polymerase sigma factor (sigma-70 family)